MKPTIAELEEFLNRPERPNVEVLPDGCVVGWKRFPGKKIEKLIHPMKHLKLSAKEYLRFIKTGIGSFRQKP